MDSKVAAADEPEAHAVLLATASSSPFRLFYFADRISVRGLQAAVEFHMTVQHGWPGCRFGAQVL